MVALYLKWLSWALSEEEEEELNMLTVTAGINAAFPNEETN